MSGLFADATLSLGRPIETGGDPVPAQGHRLEQTLRRLLDWVNTPRRGVALLIATTLAARLLFALSLGLGIDESYVVAAGRHLQLGYFDHPPVVWWLSWVMTHLAGSDTPFTVRFPFVLLFSLSTWLMFRFAADLFGERAGLWSAVLLNAVPVLGVTAGTWVLPDGPLIAALLGMGVCLVRALRSGTAAWRWWLGAGVCFGLAMSSKYTAILTGAGAVLYFVTQPDARTWLRRPQPYVAALLALAIFAPVLAWNAENGWASLLFQGGRANGGRWHPFGPLSTLGGEALFFLPWIAVPLGICIWKAARRTSADAFHWLPVCLALPPLAFFELVSLRGHVLFHWAAPGAMMALPLLGDAVGQLRRSHRAVRACLVATAVVVTSAMLLVGTEVHFNWLPRIVDDFAMGADPDLEAVDWTSLRKELAARGNLGPGLVVAAVRWSDAGKIDYALRGQATVLCLGNDPRQYGLSEPADRYNGSDILIVAPRETLESMVARFGSLFGSIEQLLPILIRHAGEPALLIPMFMGHRLDARRVL